MGSTSNSGHWTCPSCCRQFAWPAAGAHDAATCGGVAERFRVWPDGTVQAVEDGQPYAWMSDDYTVVWAADEDDALQKVTIPRPPAV